MNNRLLNAIGTIDERHIREDELADISRLEDPGASKKRKPIKLRVVLSAAAVAALMLLAGFMYRNEIVRFKFRAGVKSNYGFSFKLTLQEYTIPEEFSKPGGFFGHTDIMPGELLNMFGITMLTNDNFTETKDVKCISGATGDLNTYTWEPFVSVSPEQINFDYYLCDKKIDRAINFVATYFSGAEAIKQYDKFSIQRENDDDAEIILLNDGSPALVTDRDVTFSYNGVAYRIRFDHDGKSSSIELLKQVLDDLCLL